MHVPAVAEDMAEFMSELVGQLGPIRSRDIDDDPGGFCCVFMEPNGWPPDFVLDFKVLRGAIR